VGAALGWGPISGSSILIGANLPETIAATPVSWVRLDASDGGRLMGVFTILGFAPPFTISALE
jgi:hypothetical protein